MKLELDPVYLLRFAVSFLLANLEDEVVQDILEQEFDYEISEDETKQVTDMLKNLHLPVTVAAIKHEHGTNTYIGTQAQIDEQVYEYVQEWWPEVSKKPMPKDRKKATSYYFDNHPKGEYCDYDHHYIPIDIDD
jgi:hypothetical protein